MHDAQATHIPTETENVILAFFAQQTEFVAVNTRGFEHEGVSVKSMENPLVDAPRARSKCTRSSVDPTSIRTIPHQGKTRNALFYYVLLYV